MKNSIAKPGKVKKRQRPIRVAVCVPSHDMLPTMFAFDLAGMLVHTTGTLVAEGLVDMGLFFRPGTYAHHAREALVEQVLEEGFDYILWLDSDMRFPKDLLIQLLAHGKAMVGANYSARGIPPRFTAIEKIGIDHSGDGKQCVTNDDSTGLTEVEAIGFGALLMRTTVFASMLDSRPWFFYEYVDGTHVGEDVFFCRKAREHDWQIFVDHDLSKQVAHIGQYEYETVSVARFQDDMAAEAPAPLALTE